MPISFEQIPANVLLPLFYAEVTAAAEPIQPNLKLLLIGHMNKGAGYDEGSAVNNQLYLLSGTRANDLFGRGSMLEWMYEKARMNAPFAEIWGIAIPEDPAAVRSVGTIEVPLAGSVTRSGVGRIYIAGRAVDFAVGKTDTREKIARTILLAINNRRLPVKASGATGAVGETTVTLTCRWAGPTGNEIMLTRVGPLGPPELNDPKWKLAAAVTTLSAMVGGLAEAEVSGTFAAIGDTPFDVFVFPFAGQSSLNGCEDFMDGIAGRWSPFKQLYGHMVASVKGSFSGLFNLGVARNDPHMTIMGILKTVMPTWEWSAALGAIMTAHWSAPPELSRPLQTLELRGMYVGEDDADSFDKVEREQLLAQGISTFNVSADNTCRIDRIRTTRKYNAWGEVDAAWADAITMFQAQFFVRTMRAAITGAFPRAALTNDDTGINGFTSPNLIKQVLVHEYKKLQTLGLVENAELFTQYLVVERSQMDVNRVDVLMRPDFVNQLRILAALVETHLELDPSDPTMLQALGEALP